MLCLYPSAKDRAHLLEILRSVQDSAGVKGGCLGCWVQDTDALHNCVRYGEQWATEKDLHNHLRSDLYRRVLAAIELSQRPPEVQFHYVSETKGLELIEAVRSAPGPARAWR